MASYDEKGNKVEKKKFPFSLIISPNKQVFRKCERDKLKWKEGDLQMPCLKQIKPKTLLYKVWAFTKPVYKANRTPEDIVHIADIYADSILKRSPFGDNQLQYTHTTIEKELESLGPKDQENWLKLTKFSFIKDMKCDSFEPLIKIKEEQENGENDSHFESGIDIQVNDIIQFTKGRVLENSLSGIA